MKKNNENDLMTQILAEIQSEATSSDLALSEVHQELLEEKKKEIKENLKRRVRTISAAVNELREIRKREKAQKEKINKMNTAIKAAVISGDYSEFDKIR